jgi:hypothetical protein
MRIHLLDAHSSAAFNQRITLPQSCAQKGNLFDKVERHASDKR